MSSTAVTKPQSKEVYQPADNSGIVEAKESSSKASASVCPFFDTEVSSTESLTESCCNPGWIESQCLRRGSRNVLEQVFEVYG